MEQSFKIWVPEISSQRQVFEEFRSMDEREQGIQVLQPEGDKVSDVVPRELAVLVADHGFERFD